MCVGIGPASAEQRCGSGPTGCRGEGTHALHSIAYAGPSSPSAKRCAAEGRTVSLTHCLEGVQGCHLLCIHGIGVHLRGRDSVRNISSSSCHLSPSRGQNETRSGGRVRKGSSIERSVSDNIARTQLPTNARGLRVWPLAPSNAAGPPEGRAASSGHYWSSQRLFLIAQYGAGAVVVPSPLRGRP